MKYANHQSFLNFMGDSAKGNTVIRIIVIESEGKRQILMQSEREMKRKRYYWK